ncbi:MAG: PD-(D/E)XK nuclease family protein, partial [Clostridia bacterium]|nr:PD-(D/E)XK nuclease family protein [Clostridia bacterium]
NGRMLLLRNAKEDVSDLLTAYRGASMRPEFIQRLLAAVNELKLYGVAPADLARAAGHMPPVHGDKLRDLAAVYASYEQSLTEELHDPADLYDAMLERAEKTGFFRGKRIWIDSFAGFTPKEYAVIERMIRDAREVTLALTMDEGKEGYAPDDLFYKSYEIRKHFLSFTGRAGCAAEEIRLAGSHKFISRELSWLEENLFRTVPGPYAGERDGAVEILTLPDRRRECLAAADRLIRWSKQGYRWRDMAVIVRTHEEYAGELESVFRACGIPVYMDQSVPVSSKPLFTALLSALEAVNDSFSKESMQVLLKSGMTGFCQDDLDVLEYYILRWNIRGSKWLEPGAWKAHPDGFFQDFDEKTEKTLEKLESMREALIGPLARLKKNMKGTARERAAALYRYAVEAGLDRLTEEKAREAADRGDERASAEWDQLWDVFSTLLDQFVLITGEREYRTDEFLGMLKLMLSGIKVGAIPGRADQVTVGEAGRTRGGAPKCLIVLGNEEGVFPKTAENSSLIGDEERRMLREENVKLDLLSEEQQFVEQFLVYQTFFLPTEKLVLTWRESEGSIPSEYLDKIRRMLPGCEGTPRFEESLYLLKEDPRSVSDPVLRKAYQEAGYRFYEKGADLLRSDWQSLSPASVRALYGDPLGMSPSRIEKYHSCRFAFFLQYGLGVREFREAEFSAVEEGEFIHFVFEKLARTVKERGGFAACSEEEIRELTGKYAEEFRLSVFGTGEYLTKRVEYLFGRLASDAEKLALRMHEELKRSLFVPYVFEKSFGGQEPPIRFSFPEGDMNVSGRIDRADRFEGPDGTYLRVVDYKTGSRDFTFGDLYHGLNAQLPLYLFELLRREPTAKPAGFFYMPARNEFPSLPPDADEGAIRAEKAKLLRYKGLILDDRKLWEAMDPDYLDEEGRLPLIVSAAKNGARSVRSDSNMTDAGGFEAIRRHMERMLRQMNGEIRKGRVDADPCLAGGRSACDHCSFRPVCRVYPGKDESLRRALENMRCRDFMEKIASEEKEAEEHA